MEAHPEVAYVILDGTHKTTAAALTGSMITVAILRTKADIERMKALERRGEVFSFCVESTIAATLEDQRKHFAEFGRFETVAEKTSRMVAQRVVPEYMRREYQRVQGGRK
ncbi:MAG: hypothetical protein V1821_01280 [bacterium]